MAANALVVEMEACSCIRELHRKCETILPHHHRPQTTGEWLFKDPEMGRVAYTISILIMFSFVIVLLMIRSIRRSNSAVEVSEQAMDALLDAMRFREELDIQERQRRRLLRAKNKVTAWLTKTNGDTREKNGGRGWQSSPQLVAPRKKSSSTVSEIPEIVVTDDGPIRRAHTPCLSLIYDFNEHKKSTDSMVRSRNASPRASISSAASNSSCQRGSFSLDHEMASSSSQRLMDSHQSLSFG